MVCYWLQKINLIKGVGSVEEGFAVLSSFKNGLVENLAFE